MIRDARNVVLIGGEVFLPAAIPFEETPRRSIYLVDLTGTVFLEGLYVHGPGGGDIFTINSESATFYLQNIRAEISHADEPSDPVHADLIQPWGGHAGLHIDRFTGLSTYHGFQLRRDLAAVGPVYVRRTNLRNHPDGGSTANYLLWMGDQMSPVHVDGNTLWLDPAPDRPVPRLLHSIWPEPCELASDSLGSYATCRSCATAATSSSCKSGMADNSARCARACPRTATTFRHQPWAWAMCRQATSNDAWRPSTARARTRSGRAGRHFVPARPESCVRSARWLECSVRWRHPRLP